MAQIEEAFSVNLLRMAQLEEDNRRLLEFCHNWAPEWEEMAVFVQHYQNHLYSAVPEGIASDVLSI